jgi:hypothetical protein
VNLFPGDTEGEFPGSVEIGIQALVKRLTVQFVTTEAASLPTHAISAYGCESLKDPLVRKMAVFYTAMYIMVNEGVGLPLILEASHVRE